MTGESTERRDESHVVRHFRNHGLKLCMPLGISKIRSWWIQWSKEERQQKFAQRNLNFGNTYSVGMNFYVGGEVGNDPWLLRAYRERRLYESGYEPQGREREWPYMFDVTSYHTKKSFEEIQQENNNRRKRDNHNHDNNSDKSNNDAWWKSENIGDKKDGGRRENHGWGPWANVKDRKDDGGWDNSKKSWTDQWPKKDISTGTWQWSQNSPCEASPKIAAPPDVNIDPNHAWKDWIPDQPWAALSWQ